MTACNDGLCGSSGAIYWPTMSDKSCSCAIYWSTLNDGIVGKNKLVCLFGMQNICFFTYRKWLCFQEDVNHCKFTQRPSWILLNVCLCRPGDVRDSLQYGSSRRRAVKDRCPADRLQLRGAEHAYHDTRVQQDLGRPGRWWRVCPLLSQHRSSSARAEWVVYVVLASCLPFCQLFTSPAHKLMNFPLSSKYQFILFYHRPRIISTIRVAVVPPIYQHIQWCHLLTNIFSNAIYWPTL